MHVYEYIVSCSKYFQTNFDKKFFSFIPSIQPTDNFFGKLHTTLVTEIGCVHLFDLSSGMEKEVQNLIKENDELLATKNALNIVKDDLIAKVDELQSDLTISREEVQQLTAVKDKLKARISSMEKELKETKEQLNEMKQKAAARAEVRTVQFRDVLIIHYNSHSKDDQEGLPMGQRKRFTRLEMAKVLKERNQYKEKLIELQEAIRWTQVIRESKAEGEKRSAIWKL